MKNLIDILTEVGAKNCLAQPLPDCMTGISTSKNGVSTIKFLTSNLTATDVATDSPKFAAFVLWVPIDEFRRAAMDTPTAGCAA